MKQEYLNNLSQEFDNKGVAVETYSQIVDKYSTWYDKLLSDGKSDDEIYTILKSPEEVAAIFAEKFMVKSSEVAETTVEQPVFTETKEQAVQETTQEFNQQPSDYNVAPPTQSSKFDRYIVKTDRRGRDKFYEKRSFGGKIGIFLLFLLASTVCLPILFGLFSATLTLSFTFMLLFFTPFYYLVFIWRYDSVSYLQAVSSGNNLASDILTLPIDKINDIIAYLNQITEFQFPVFLQAILMSIFGFAGLLLALFLCLNMFRANVWYFSAFFNKIGLKRVKDKDLYK